MRLSERQIDRFYDLLDGLIVFANARLGLVEHLSFPFDNRESEMKASYVCDELWRHPEVIEEYVRQNPHGRSHEDLRTIAAWSDALTARFVLVCFASDSPVLMCEAGLFVVAGMDADQAKHLPQCPDSVVTTLLPFEGLIISDGMMYGDGVSFSAADLEFIRKSLAEFSTQGVAASAEDFALRARPYKERLRELELDELMADIELEARQMREGERLPDGYHRGVLAGVSGEERARLIKGHMEAGMSAVSARIVQDAVSVQALSHEPVSSLTACLELCLKRDELLSLCKRVGLSGYSRCKKGELAALLSEALVCDLEGLSQSLLAAEDHVFASFQNLIKQGGRVEGAVADYDVSTLPDPLWPYAFQFLVEDRLVTLVPDELMPLFDASVMEDIAWRRERVRMVVNCAEAMAEYYGILSISEAYDLYRTVVVNAVAKDDFHNILMSFDEAGFHSYTTEMGEEDDFLCYYSISEWFLYQDRATKRAEQRKQYLAECGGKLDGALLKKWDEEFDEETQDEREALESYRRRVLELRSHMARRPLPASALEGSILPLLLDLPPLRQLRDFYDAHVPDGEDDYVYADRMTEELVCFSFDGGNIDYYLGELQAQGRNGCAEDADLLLRFVENAWSALPSWELNGWSSQELVEQMSGRKVFYNARGMMAHPVSLDPCPCGSGKPYGECHGR